MSDRLGLVDFAIGLVIFALNLPTWQVLFFGKFKLQKELVEMTCGPVQFGSYSLLEWQAVKLTFFAPCMLQGF